jgi:hypothetical protein
MFKMAATRMVLTWDRNLSVFLILFSCLVASSCGTKTFPRPIQTEPSMQIKDLQAQVRSRKVELTWSVTEYLTTRSKYRNHQFVIQRAEVSWENRNCLDCPAPYEEVQVIDLSQLGRLRTESNKYLWVDPNVAPNHVYRYQITIRSEKGRLESVSNASLAKVIPAPGAVAKVNAVTERQGILVRWQKPQKDQTGSALQGQLRFVVERLTTGKGHKWETVSPVPVDGSEYLDTTVASNQSYDYRVTPVLIFEDSNIYGESAVVQYAKAPDAVTPPPPQSVWVIPAKGSLEVHWIESEGTVAGYHVYRRQGQEIIRLTVNPLGHPPYVDNHAKKNETYFYAVSAVGSSPQQQEGLLSKWVEIRNAFFD